MDDFDEFANLRQTSLQSLHQDETLKRQAMDFIRDAGRKRYSYNFDWLGMPIIQFPQDIVGLQDIIWRTRPEVIVETGVARGGSLVFAASMLAFLEGERQVIGIEVDMKPHNLARIREHPLGHRIEIVEGSSIDPAIVARVHELVAGRNALVILDSMHSHDHVLAELHAYAVLVPVGGYLVVFDTVIEDMPDDYFPNRPWDKGSNPKSAVRQFLTESGRFEIDHEIEAKLMITCAPDGWLRRVR